jgi:CelD/BcsL family acetyltransferase involved in cellulose biosynthesis
LHFIVLVSTLDPIGDPRWAAFVNSEPRASVFHTSAWLEALRRTYAYEPVVYTTSSSTAPILTNGLLLSRVKSWLTGTRLVGIPFADHCEPLIENREQLDAILEVLRQGVKTRLWRYVELRPKSAIQDPSLRPIDEYWFHQLDLGRPLDELHQALHKNSIRRKLRRADREDLQYTRGNSGALLDQFYRLLLLTRRRHGLPPQPFEWFSNLAACFAGRFTVHMIFKDHRPVATMITLRHADVLVYKYGASDARFHPSGVMPLLFWNVIREAKSMGIREFDLGRSRIDNAGLITFKDRLGASRLHSTYMKISRPQGLRGREHEWIRSVRPILARMPNSFLVAAGRFLYKHIG